MEQFTEGESTREEIKNKLRQNFDGKIVRKDLTKKIKEGANVPVYVLEFLLGQYCSSDDETVIEKGVQNVKRILADNFVRPDESQKILSQLRKKGSHTIIDMVTVHLDMKRDCFFAEFSNLGIGNVPIADEYPEKFDRLLCGGIWCIVQLDYEVEGDNNFGIEDIDGNPLRSKQKKQKDISPISIRKLTPIQMPHIDIDELKQGRTAFTKNEWLDILLRSIGMEPDEFTYREKWLLLTRMIPLVENNFNLCELGPRSTMSVAGATMPAAPAPASCPSGVDDVRAPTQNLYGKTFDEFVKASAGQQLIYQAIAEKEGLDITEYEYKRAESDRSASRRPDFAAQRYERTRIRVQR